MNNKKPNWKRVKVINSHSGYGRFLAECDDTHLEIERIPEIPSPYAYSPTWGLLDHERHGLVFVRETSHRRYEVFQLTSTVGVRLAQAVAA